MSGRPTDIDHYSRGGFWVALTTLTILALASRLYGIGTWSVTGDEYFTILFASDRIQSWLNPLGYLLAVISFDWFGVSEWSARIAPALLGAFAIPLLYATLRTRVSDTAAVLASALLLVSAWHLMQSQFSRFYTGVMFFSILAFYYFSLATKTHKPIHYLGFAGASVVASLFHATAALVPATCLLFLFVDFVLFQRTQPSTGHGLTWKLTILVVLALALIVPVFENLYTNWKESGQMWGRGPIGIVLQLTNALQLPVLLIALFGLVSLIKTNRRCALFFGCTFLVPVLGLLVGATIFSVRPDYVFFTLPIIFCLTAITFDQVHASSTSRWPAHLLATIAIASQFPGFVSHYSEKLSFDVRDTVAFVSQHSAVSDKILNFDNGFKYYSQTNPQLIRYLGDPYNNEIAWEQRIEDRFGDVDRLWIVIPARRQSVAPTLQHWLFCNSSLVHRNIAVRLDYSVVGVEVFVADRQIRSGRKSGC